MDDVVVVGAGCIGLSTALHLALRGLQVTVVEKEPGPGRHQSSNNSGVIHAGYNLKPGSIKARMCVEGARRLKEFCAEHEVPVHGGGILVVAKDETQEATLERLADQGRANGVKVALVDAAGLRDFEPAAAGRAALHAPEGASLDARAYIRALAKDLQECGVHLSLGARARTVQDDGVVTDRGFFPARVVVNAAGLQADRLAGKVADDLRVVPFRGYYAELRPAARDLVRSHIYGAPDPAYPFLGVHLSRQTDDRVTAGPGAMLALGREAYGFWSLDAKDLIDTMRWPGFWKMLQAGAWRQVPAELHKSLRLGAIWKEAQALVPALRKDHFVRGGAGIRAQLVDRDGRLVDDMLVRETEHAVHVLNAVSPGLTASLPFGEHVAALAAAKV